MNSWFLDRFFTKNFRGVRIGFCLVIFLAICLIYWNIERKKILNYQSLHRQEHEYKNKILIYNNMGNELKKNQESLKTLSQLYRHKMQFLLPQNQLSKTLQMLRQYAHTQAVHVHSFLPRTEQDLDVYLECPFYISFSGKYVNCMQFIQLMAQKPSIFWQDLHISQKEGNIIVKATIVICLRKNSSSRHRQSYFPAREKNDNPFDHLRFMSHHNSLDSISIRKASLVGILHQGKKTRALIRSAHGQIFLVKVGDHFGNPNRRVVVIDSQHVQIEDRERHIPHFARKIITLTLPNESKRKISA